MAGNNSQTYKLINGITVPMLGQAVVDFLRFEKHMVAEGTPTPEGYFVQAKSDDDAWKKVAGMSKAIQVQIINGGEMATVSIGQGKWSDKVGAGVVGAFLFAPLAVTAIVGTVAQNKLPGEILAFCERYLVTGGSTPRINTAPMNYRMGGGSYGKCKNCGATQPEGTRFCSECGSAMAKSCPTCGSPVDDGARFCPHCGTGINVPKTCPGCGQTVQAGQSFCPNCGTRTQEVA